MIYLLLGFALHLITRDSGSKNSHGHTWVLHFPLSNMKYRYNVQQCTGINGNYGNILRRDYHSRTFYGRQMCFVYLETGRTMYVPRDCSNSWEEMKLKDGPVENPFFPQLHPPLWRDVKGGNKAVILNQCVVRSVQDCLWVLCKVSTVRWADT